MDRFGLPSKHIGHCPEMEFFMGQTRMDSVFESVTNIAIGYTVALLSQLVIYPAYGMELPFSINLQIGAWFTLVSLVRSYTLRRWFNARIGHQTRMGSLMEATGNVAIGYVVALLSQLTIFPAYGLNVSFNTNLQIGAWFTLVSLLRSYTVRRWFNART